MKIINGLMADERNLADYLLAEMDSADLVTDQTVWRGTNGYALCAADEDRPIDPDFDVCLGTLSEMFENDF